MDGNIFNGIIALAWLGLLLVPLGIWKLIEIVIWLFNHISITIG